MKKDDKGVYKKYVVNDINLDEVDKILNDHITTYSKKFDLFYKICIFEIEFDNIYTAVIETNYYYNIDSDNIKSFLLYYIDSCQLAGYKFIR